MKNAAVPNPQVEPKCSGLTVGFVFFFLTADVFDSCQDICSLGSHYACFFVEPKGYRKEGF